MIKRLFLKQEWPFLDACFRMWYNLQRMQTYNIENNHPLISVLVPAYQAEKHIEKCLSSIVSQSWTDLEIIVVDDGSKDRTGEIADDFASRDERVRVIHKENAGVAAARNTLLDASNGEYILQVDADDYISPKAVETLYKTMMDTRADLCVCTMTTGGCPDYDFPEKDHRKIETLEGREKFHRLFDDRKFDSIVPWEKLYKRELFDGLRYPDGKIHEDEYLAHHILDRAKRVTYTDDVLFYYTVEKKSITKSSFSLKRLDCVPALLDRISFFEKYGDAGLLRLVYIDFLKRFQYYYYGVSYHFPEKTELRQKLFDQYATVYRKAHKKHMLSQVQKVLFGLFIISPWLNYQARKVFHKKAIDT